MRNLLEITSHKDFHNFQVQTEYTMNEIDLESRQRIFTLSETTIDNKPVAYLSITNLISGMLISKSFRLSIFTSNGYNCDDNLYERLYLRTNFTEISGQAKFKSTLASRNIDILLVIFSDDFGKNKRSKWNPIDAVYLAFGNLPLQKRFLHKNIFVFSIIDHIPFYKSIELLMNSIDKLNGLNYEIFFPEMEKLFKVNCFIQLFS